MPRAGRPIVLALLCLGLLSACTDLETSKPLLTAADARGAPAVRPGVWLLMNDPGCKLDERLPIYQWPDCADGIVVKPGQLRILPKKDTTPSFDTASFILAAGDPRILQLGSKPDGAPAGADTYDYAIAGPTVLDTQGRIVLVTFWAVLCGPPAPRDSADDDIISGSLKPLPGLTTAPGRTHCSTDSADALRAAAKASVAWKDSPISARWVRDGDK